MWANNDESVQSYLVVVSSKKKLFEVRSYYESKLSELGWNWEYSSESKIVFNKDIKYGFLDFVDNNRSVDIKIYMGKKHNLVGSL